MKWPTQTCNIYCIPRSSALRKQFIKSLRVSHSFRVLHIPLFLSLILSRVLELIFDVFHYLFQSEVLHYTKRLLKSYEFGIISSICHVKLWLRCHFSADHPQAGEGPEWEMQMLPQSHISLHVSWTAAVIWQDCDLDFREGGFTFRLNFVLI